MRSRIAFWLEKRRVIRERDRAQALAFKLRYAQDLRWVAEHRPDLLVRRPGS